MEDVFIPAISINAVDGLMHLRNIHQGDVENLVNSVSKSGILRLIMTAKINENYVYRAFIRSDYGNSIKEQYEGRWEGRFYRKIQREVNSKNYTEVIIIKGLAAVLGGDLIAIAFSAVPIQANEVLFKSVLKAKISPGLAKWIQENTIAEVGEEPPAAAADEPEDGEPAAAGEEPEEEAVPAERDDADTDSDD